ncbi:hypothetical protein PHISCL_07292 [Aspergillus sclerotialis]|uniref:Cyclin-dependent protein kinase complex component n=1 Tax=Aspergillus sclerotialis TaxID=2070753 RepID=A0A3A2ZR34_9EURO|nr:hypothetical protein PHISCL_07292 [Aspergillus sclerotialis]
MDARSRFSGSAERQELSDNISSSKTQLVLSSGIRESMSTTTLVLSGTPEIYDISPFTALELLYLNVENLVRLTPEASEPFSRVTESAPIELSQRIKAVAEHETTSLSVREFHCSPAADHTAIQARHDFTQLSVLVKRFLSKREPPIPLRDYLLRLHRYCPMSTAVYLATSTYITKMVATERVISLIPRNIHRLVLAGLRVAMKALEDISYPHSRFAKVGGVSERELSRLEISFCFLADFELRVDAQMLIGEARLTRSRVKYLSSLSSS